MAGGLEPIYDDEFTEMEEFFRDFKAEAIEVIEEAYSRRSEFLDDAYRAYIILMRRKKLQMKASSQ